MEKNSTSIKAQKTTYKSAWNKTADTAKTKLRGPNWDLFTLAEFQNRRFKMGQLTSNPRPLTGEFVPKARTELLLVVVKLEMRTKPASTTELFDL